MANKQGLTVRRTERQEIALPCELWIAPAHATFVNFTAKAASVDSKVEATALDASSGGLGVMTPVYIPKGALVHLSFIDTEKSSNTPVEALFRVQRILMTDRRPGYLLGLAYEDIDSESSQEMAQFVLALEGADDA